MTREQLLKENQELKNKVVELQSEIIRLQSQLIPGSPGPPQKEVLPFKPYYLPHPLTGGTGDPLPTPYTD